MTQTSKCPECAQFPVGMSCSYCTVNRQLAAARKDYQSAMNCCEQLVSAAKENARLRGALEEISNRKLYPGVAESMREDARETLAQTRNDYRCPKCACLFQGGGWDGLSCQCEKRSSQSEGAK